MAPEDPSDWWSSAHHSNCGSSLQVGPARMHSDVTHHFHTRGFWLRKKQEQTSERDRRSFTSADMQFPLLDFLFFPAIHPIFGFSPPGRQQRAFALLIASDIPTLPPGDRCSGRCKGRLPILGRRSKTTVSSQRDATHPARLPRHTDASPTSRSPQAIKQLWFSHGGSRWTDFQSRSAG